MKKLVVLLPILIYVAASTWANFDLFPEGFMEYWWFDDIGHIIVFGTVAGSLIYISKHLGKPWWYGTALACALAVLDELSQLYISARSFTLHDLYMSLVGIFAISLGYVLFSSIKRLNDR